VSSFCESDENFRSNVLQSERKFSAEKKPLRYLDKRRPKPKNENNIKRDIKWGLNTCKYFICYGIGSRVKFL